MSTNRHEATKDAFFALIRSGLWEEADTNLDLNANLLETFGTSDQGRANLDLNVNIDGKVDWAKVYQLAEEQSVVGLVTAGIERLKNANVNLNLDLELLLQMIGEVQIIEQQNKAMNQFIEKLVKDMREAGIYTLLVKGQGIAQCYDRPLWRASGDVDLFLSDDNYQKAKSYLILLANSVEPEGIYKKHLEMVIDPWVVELHGSMRSGLSSRVDNVIDETQNEVFYGGNVRTWMNGKTQVFLPGINCDVIFVFTHFIKHFYCEGLGVRQICDWCRLLWTYKDILNLEILESQIKKMGLMSEWKAFASFSVNFLGMPLDAMPFYSDDVKWKCKADKIGAFILEVGNFGHNRDMSYFEKYPYLIRKVCSMGRRCGDLIRHARIFPLDSLRFFPNIMLNGLRSAVRGE